MIKYNDIKFLEQVTENTYSLDFFLPKCHFTMCHSRISQRSTVVGLFILSGLPSCPVTHSAGCVGHLYKRGAPFMDFK